MNNVYPLHEAARRGDLEKVTELLKNNPGLVFIKGNGGETPLHCAAAIGHEYVVKFLIANKAEVNARDDFGSTPLHQAAGKGHGDVVKLLLVNQADVNAREIDGTTPLHLAALFGRKAVVESLLANQAKADARNNNGDTALNNALSRGYNDVAELLSRYTLLDDESLAASIRAMESLYEAIRQGNREKVEMLIDESPDMVFSKNSNSGATPLHGAAFGGFKDLTELLLANKAEANAIDKDGLTPLHYAAAKGYMNVVELLLANGANVNVEAADGRTAFQTAMRNGYKEVANLISPSFQPLLAKANWQRRTGIILLIVAGVLEDIGCWVYFRRDNETHFNRIYSVGSTESLETLVPGAIVASLCIFLGLAIVRRYKSSFMITILYLVFTGIIPGLMICAGWEMIFKYRKLRKKMLNY